MPIVSWLRGQIWLEPYLHTACTIYIYIYSTTYIYVGRNWVTSIAIRYGVGGPGIESRWGRNVPYSSRPALEHTQSPVQWVAGLFPRGIKRPGRGLFHSLPSGLNKEYSCTSTSPLVLYGLFLGERSLYGIYSYVYIQGVTGGTDQTSGECSLW